jgi:organic radical activating enzyme
MFGNNKILAPSFGDGQVLEIQHIFATLQGEGIYVGVPAVFIRLGGCNLACAFCDTEFDNFTPLPLAQITQQTIELSKNNAGLRIINLAVITGGEPLRQNISPLCKSLLDEGFLVQIETNGTLYRELPQGVEIICSPKNVAGNYTPLRPDLLPRISALKFVISASNENYKNTPDYIQNNSPFLKIPVFVQPMDDGDAGKNAANTSRAIELAMQHGYRLSLQTHKILNIE